MRFGSYVVVGGRGFNGRFLGFGIYCCSLLLVI